LSHDVYETLFIVAGAMIVGIGVLFAASILLPALRAAGWLP
jgi:hypothetical protein